MHEKAQKSPTTTLPRKLSAVSGGEFSQSVAPANEGISPPMGKLPAGLAADIMACPSALVLLIAMVELLMAMFELLMAIIAPPGAPAFCGLILSMRDCSRLFVPLSDKRVSTVESQPNTIATTASSTATPRPRLIHSPVPNDFFKSANTRPPASNATANEVAAPAAYANSSKVVRAFGPEIAAPVRMRPKMGPAQGAQSRPVAIPSSKEFSSVKRPAASGFACVSRLPSATKGRASQSAKRVDKRVAAKAVNNTSAKMRPY